MPAPMTTRQSSLMIVAGDPSGDIHAARVVSAILRKNKKLKIFGMGGPALAKAGMETRDDLTRPAIMGFVEVVKHLPLLRRRFRDCERWLKEEKPDLLLLVDYPGFNLRLAQKAEALGVPVCYYIAPQVWAWHAGRLKIMKKVIRKLLVILPFEKKFFEKEGLPAVYVGHPLLEEVAPRSSPRESVLQKNGIPADKFPLISAMPGSRKSELEKIWPLYLEASRDLRKKYPDAAFVVPRPAGLDFTDYPGLTPDDPFFFADAPAFELRQACDLAWVKSGTSTLETALLKTPMILVYKVAVLTGYLAKRLLKIKYVGLVNLLADREVVPELLQERAEASALVEETTKLLDSAVLRKAQVWAFEKIRKNLATPVKSSEMAAKEILKSLSEVS